MTLLGLSLDAWLTLGVVLVVIVGLVHGRVGADLLVLSGVAALLAAGVLEPKEAVRGFANPAVVTVGLLYIVAAGLRETGAVTALAQKVLGSARSNTRAQTRMCGAVAVASAFINNTPIVAMFVPALSDWARRNDMSVSRLFMPLSFAAILGGMCTLIGTSTNIVVNELIIEELDRVAGDPNALAPPGLQTFGMFTLAWIGVPALLVGVAYMTLTGRWLLKDRLGRPSIEIDPREYMVSMRVDDGAAIVGRTVEQASLRHLPGLFLSRIDRQDEEILAVEPTQKLQSGDVLVFVGSLDSIVDLQRIRGLSPMTGEAGKSLQAARHSARLVEVVVSRTSPLLGRTIREGSFRSRYDAVVIGVHRNGERLGGKIGDIRVRPGDTLLLEASPRFGEIYRDSQDFYLVNELPGAAAPRHGRAGVAIGVLAALVVAVTLRPGSAMTAALVAALAMVLLRCLTGPTARASVDWTVLVVIGSTFGLAGAMDKTGLASVIAGGLLRTVGELGPTAVLAMIFVVTAIFTAVITNNAAAVLVFPIALEAARASGINGLQVSAVVAIAASAGFATPLAYQTNLMVMGPGGYRASDFARFGGPLTLLIGVVCVLLAPLVY